MLSVCKIAVRSASVIGALRARPCPEGVCDCQRAFVSRHGGMPHLLRRVGRSSDALRQSQPCRSFGAGIVLSTGASVSIAVFSCFLTVV